MDEAAVAWLREQVQARLAAARAATAGPWQSLIEGRDHWGGDSFVMTEGEDLYPHVNVGGHDYNRNWEADQDFIAANDPRDVIARCEAELGILDEHYIFSSAARMVKYGIEPREGYEEFSVVTSGMPGGPGDQGMGCVTCHYWGMGGVKGFGVCRTVRHVASGYRHQSGYAEHWCADGQ